MVATHVCWPKQTSHLSYLRWFFFIQCPPDIHPIVCQITMYSLTVVSAANNINLVDLSTFVRKLYTYISNINLGQQTSQSKRIHGQQLCKGPMHNHGHDHTQVSILLLSSLVHMFSVLFNLKRNNFTIFAEHLISLRRSAFANPSWPVTKVFRRTLYY